MLRGRPPDIPASARTTASGEAGSTHRRDHEEGNCTEPGPPIVDHLSKAPIQRLGELVEQVEMTRELRSVCCSNTGTFQPRRPLTQASGGAPAGRSRDHYLLPGRRLTLGPFES